MPEDRVVTDGSEYDEDDPRPITGIKDLMRTPEMSETERHLRKMLWLNHGCSFSALYGDDGEMSCGICRIDFLRWTPEMIENARVIKAQRSMTTILKSIEGQAKIIRREVDLYMTMIGNVFPARYRDGLTKRIATALERDSNGIIRAARQLFENRMGWKNQQTPTAPAVFWADLGEAIYGPHHTEVLELRSQRQIERPEPRSMLEGFIAAALANASDEHVAARKVVEVIEAAQYFEGYITSESFDHDHRQLSLDEEPPMFEDQARTKVAVFILNEEDPSNGQPNRPGGEKDSQSNG